MQSLLTRKNKQVERAKGSNDVSNTESIIIDSISNGMLWNENDIQSEAISADVAALLLLGNLKSSTIKLDIMGVKQKLQIKVNIENNIFNHDVNTITPDKFKQLIKEVPKYFKGAKNKSFGKGIEIQIMGKGSFHVYPSTGNKKHLYFLNFSCAPNTILTGGNSIPSLEIKTAKDAVELTSLPVRIVASLIDQCVLSKVFDNKKKSSLWSGLEDKTLSLKVNRLQIAMYTPLFNFFEERNNGLLVLYSKLNTEDYKIEGGGYSVKSHINIKIDTSETTYTYSDDDKSLIKSMSGFLVKQYSGRNHISSIGFYAKDLKERGESELNDKPYDMPAEYTTSGIDRRIRIDITLQYRGLQSFANHIVGTKFEEAVTLRTINDIFEVLLKEKQKSKLILDFTLKDKLRLDQLLGVTKKDWMKAFDIMKDKGYYNVVDFYKSWGGGNEKFSLKAALEKHGLPEGSFSKLKKTIQDKTGVDINFSYKVWQASNQSVIRMFLDNDVMDDFFEGKKRNYIDYEGVTKAAVKQTYRTTKNIYRRLMKNGAASFNLSTST